MKDIAGMGNLDDGIHRKIEAYELIGDFYSQDSENEKALKYFKKVLEYAWSCNDTEKEIKAYDRIA